MRAALLLLAIWPGAVLGQEECAAVWGVAQAVADVEGKARATQDGWCEVRPAGLGGLVTGSYGADVRLDAIRWRGEGLRALAEGTGLPTALEVEVEGFRVVPRSGDPVFDWLLDAQSARAGIDGRLAAAWDAGTREARVTELRLDFPGRNALSATATLAGIDLSSFPAFQTSLGSMGLTSLEAEIVADGLFESYLLMPVGPVLLEGAENPQAEAERLRTLAIGLIGRAPEAIFPDPTRAELAELVGELPNPSGTLSLRVVAEEGGGLGLPRFSRFMLLGLPDTPEELWPALEGVRVEAGWTPLPPDE